jgi:aldose 1-epimerase
MERLTTDVLDVELLPAVGGRCHRIRAFGHDLIRRPPTVEVLDDDPFFWGWFPLVPWTNRVPDGRLRWEGQVIQLPPNYPDGSALHGQGYAASWTVVGEGDFELRHPGGDFPWPYVARQRWTAEGATLTLVLSVTNDGDEAMPAGLGIHPWWVADGGLEVHVPCHAAYRCEDGLAIGDPVPAPPVDGVVPWGTDHQFTALDRQEVGLRWPGHGLAATLAFSPTADHIQIAAFEDAGAVAVEPVTHAGDGHRRLEAGEPGAIDVLDPGATLTVEYHLSVSEEGGRGVG